MIIETQDILGIGAVIIFSYFIIKSASKKITEVRIKRKINKKTIYPPISTQEKIQQQKELQKQIIKHHNQYYEKIFEEKEFLNKNTESLSEFIINQEMNGYDLHKLAQLNGIKVEMGGGWNELALDLIRELDKSGWNKKVSSIKEKFGELRFYAETEREDILDKYSEKSMTICEICGKPGNHFTVNGWDFTRCIEHNDN